MKHSFYTFLFIVVFLSCPTHVRAESYKIFQTKYTKVFYKDNQDLDDFIWKLGGQRLEFLENTEMASSRIDRIINRVQSILDMWPKDFKVDIFLYRGKLQFNKVAYYQSEDRSMHVCLDYTSDGVVAHEIAHAVIYQYFPFPPPSRTQEILSQYVDQHLWSDY